MTAKEEDKTVNRRSVLKGTAGLLSIGGLASTAQAASDNEDGGPEVEPEVMTNATHRFDPQTVSVGDTTYARGTGSWTTPTIGDIVQFDMFIAAENIGRPTITASNFPNIESGFHYDSGSDNPLGESAYHFSTGQFTIIAPFGTTRYLDVKIPTFHRGRVEGKSGTLWPWWDFAVGYLDIK
ncbi:hypothetical protein U3A55_11630 [Salarchaeum sp. III]|uniref:hypothetical protein n=1 Tax=Salarchaeum sp. III TaxID=3107927 RepID=UPI002EDB8517